MHTYKLAKLLQIVYLRLRYACLQGQQ